MIKYILILIPIALANPMVKEADEAIQQLKKLQPKSWKTKYESVLIKACDNGNGKACGNMAALHATGQGGLAKDKNLAANYYTKACEKGAFDRCLSAGVYVGAGHGKSPSGQKAVDLFVRGCKNGFFVACTNILLARLSPKAPWVESFWTTQKLPLKKIEGKRVYKLTDKKWADMAVPVLTKNCEEKVSAACHNLVAVYKNGIGVSRDLNKVSTFIEKSCQAGNKKMCERHESWKKQKKELEKKMKADKSKKPKLKKPPKPVAKKKKKSD